MQSQESKISLEFLTWELWVTQVRLFQAQLTQNHLPPYRDITVTEEESLTSHINLFELENLAPPLNLLDSGPFEIDFDTSALKEKIS